MTRARRPDAARRGRDRRARVLLPAPGAPRVPGGRPPTPAGVGGGIAGRAAPTARAARGGPGTRPEREPAHG
ncbi:isorenieratene synthase, partial [Streptomyces antibioticus]